MQESSGIGNAILERNRSEAVLSQKTVNRIRGSKFICCTGILGVPAGALSILFAILSKRKGESLSGMSITGIVTSAIGILLGILAVAYSIYLLFYDPTFREQIDIMMQQMYGVSLEEFFSMYF